MGDPSLADSRANGLDSSLNRSQQLSEVSSGTRNFPLLGQSVPSQSHAVRVDACLVPCHRQHSRSTVATFNQAFDHFDLLRLNLKGKMRFEAARVDHVLITTNIAPSSKQINVAWMRLLPGSSTGRYSKRDPPTGRAHQPAL